MFLSVTGYFSPPVALFAGVVFSLTLGHPFASINNKIISLLLRLSIIGLGLGINLDEAMHVGRDGLLFTIVSIAATLVIGLLAGKWLNLSKNSSVLISVGTAICGGSAIAAMSPILNAEEKEVSMSFGIVFLLNAAALLLFPVIGHALAMSQEQFGLWSAIAIHDTSSVVGAAQTYGNKALQLATTVKLERALWIIPIAIGSAFILKKNKSVKFPYFILLFVLAIVLNSYNETVHAAGIWVVPLAKKGMTLTLFLIGAGLSIESLKNVGIKPLLLGLGLWIIISLGSLAAILTFYF